MFMVKKFICILSIVSVSAAFAKFEIDEKETHKEFEIDMQSGKEDDTRYYEGKFSKVVEAPLNSVKNSIVNFDQKCNNELKDKRKVNNEKFECKYHNPSQIEAVIVKDIEQKDLEKNEIERYMVNRYIYNRDYYQHSDKVQVFKEGEKLIIVHQMMPTDEAKKFSKHALEKNSAFNKTKGTFTLTPLSKEKTQVDYIYEMYTDHWVLNKSISVGKVFTNMSASLNDLVSSIFKESKAQAESQRAIGSSN